jgi:hypothetical protein
MGTPTEGLRSRLSGMVDEEQKETEEGEGEEKRRGEQDLVTPGGAVGSSRGKGKGSAGRDIASERTSPNPAILSCFGRLPA